MEDKLTIKTPIPATSASRILSPVSRLSHSPQTARLAGKLRQNSRDFLYHSVLSGYFLRVFVSSWPKLALYKCRARSINRTFYAKQTQSRRAGTNATLVAPKGYEQKPPPPAQKNKPKQTQTPGPGASPRPYFCFSWPFLT